MENYQIQIIKYLDGNYIRSCFENDDKEISEMANILAAGYNENEVMLVPKTIKKRDFFEKFFQLFS